MRFTDAAETALMEATREIAKTVILPRYRALDRSEIDTKTAADDLVTVADKESEARLTEVVRRIMPGAAVIGEEAVSADPARLDALANAEVAVVIDPIDGTWNFANGVNTFGVILAVVEEGRTTWGGLYDPLGDDWMIARDGGGAWFVGADGARSRIGVGAAPEALSEAAGSIPLYMYQGPAQHRLAALFPSFRRVHSLRCSMHEYRLMAEGRSDFNLTALLHPWDHAAGVLVAKEAGATARLLDGRAYAPTLREGRLLTARSEALWEQLAKAFEFIA